MIFDYYGIQSAAQEIELPIRLNEKRSTILVLNDFLEVNDLHLEGM
jgi:hypothetical protein